MLERAWPPGGASYGVSEMPPRCSPHTGFTLTALGTLSLGGPEGHEATIFVHLDDYLVRVRLARADGTAASVWTWSEDRNGLRCFLAEVNTRIALAPDGDPAPGWQSLVRWAKRQKEGWREA